MNHILTCFQQKHICSNTQVLFKTKLVKDRMSSLFHIFLFSFLDNERWHDATLLLRTEVMYLTTKLIILFKRDQQKWNVWNCGFLQHKASMIKSKKKYLLLWKRMCILTRQNLDLDKYVKSNGYDTSDEFLWMWHFGLHIL